jgi:hypothetical protein
MSFVSGRNGLILAALLSLTFGLAACSEYKGEIWNVDYSKGVQLPPSEFPDPNNNPPPKT